MSQTVDELVTILTLDTSEWEKDYQKANKKVKDAAKQLTQENRTNKVQLQLEMLGADAASGKISSISRQISILTEMVNTQKQAVLLHQNAFNNLTTVAAGYQTKMASSVSKTDVAYKELEARYKATNAASIAMGNNVGKEQIALAKLESQLRTTTLARTAAYKAMAASAYTFVNTASLALAAVGAASVAMAVKVEQENKRFSLAFGSSADSMREWSKTAGESIGGFDDDLRNFAVQMNQALDNMNFTMEESQKVSQEFAVLAFNLAAMRGENPEEIFNKLRSGVLGQVRGLKELNVIVTDNMITQYAYTNGIAAQDATLSEHQKALARIGIIQQQTADATGYMAKNSSDANVQMMQLKEHIADQAKSLGKDLLPAYKDLLTMLDKAAKAYNAFNEASNGANSEIVTAGVEMAAFNRIPFPAWLKLAGDIAIATYNLQQYINRQKDLKDTNETKYVIGEAPSATQAKLRWNEARKTYQKEIEGTPLVIAPWFNTYEWKDLSPEELANVKKKQAAMDDAKAKAENSSKITDAEKAREEAKQKALNEADLAAKKEITLSLYKLTHDELQNELHDLDEKFKTYREKHIDDLTLTEWYESSKAKIMRDYNDSTVAKIKEAFQSELQNRLDQIEIEKRAYRQKGIDEVQATKWAEEEKRKAVQSTALDAIKNNRKLLEDVRDAMVSTTATYTKNGETHTLQYSNADRLKRLQENLLKQKRKELGIKEGDTFSPELIKQYSDIQSFVQNNMVPGLTMDKSMGDGLNGFNTEIGGLPNKFAAVGQQSAAVFFAPFDAKVQDLANQIGAASTNAGTNSKPNIVNHNNIDITIDKPVVRSESDIAEITNQVSTNIENAIQNATGGAANGY